MSPPDPVRAIADAVLYEGYVLWPYRRSALKNTRRFTFGGVHPPAHAAAHPDDAATMRTEVVVEGRPEARVDVEVRFLHVVRRQVMRGGEPVDELVVDGERHVSWEEAAERTVTGATIDIPAGREEEALTADAAIVRSWDGLAGTVTVATDPLGPNLRRLTVEIANTTPFDGAGREAALARTFCSTHTVLRAPDAAFVSATDPPHHLAAVVAACRNERTWPVLVGEAGDRTTMLSSPIILEEYPRIAPESPGDLFDGGEIDQLLTLSILALTDAEKEEMRASDPRAREILERTEALTPEQLMRLHGTVRDLQVRP
jgi:hypothetical protein